MVDCHIHMVLDGVNWKDAIARHKAAPQEALIRQTLGHYQALGFSYLRDGGDRWGVCDLAAKLAPEYGIRYRSPGFPQAARRWKRTSPCPPIRKRSRRSWLFWSIRRTA